MSKQDNCLIEQLLQTFCTPPAEGQTEAARKNAILESNQNYGVDSAFIRFMDEMPGGFLIYYASCGEEIIYANQSLLRIFRCKTMEEFRAHTGNSFRGLVYPDDLDSVENSVRAQAASSQHDSVYVEYRIRRTDGEIRWVEDYGHFLHSESAGDIFYVFLSDATEKRERLINERDQLIDESRQKELALRNLTEAYDKERTLINQQYLRQLEVIDGLSISYESICYLDLDSNQITPFRLSVRTAPLFDGTHEPRAYTEYAKDYVFRWVHPEDRDIVIRATSSEYIRRKLTENRTYYFNYRVLFGEEPQFIQLRIVNVGQKGRVSQAVLGYRRVDEEIRQQLEQQALLAEALSKANLAAVSKTTFLSNMSHEMRTPLHAIFGFTSLAKLSVSDPEVMDYLDRVEHASRQLLEMIEKVLEASSLSDDDVNEVECNLKETVQDVYDFLQPQAAEKAIEFTLDFRALHRSAVYADRNKLRQLILYLVNNSVTYTNPGGRISIAVAEEPAHSNEYAQYCLTVSDTGAGMSEEYIKQVFEPFSREKNSTLSGVHGIGLGLTIAKSIVDMMHGTIRIDSVLGQGTTFTIMLTLRLQPEQERRRMDVVAEEGTQRLLLIEDNDLNREIEVELLEKLGFRIDAVKTGQAALKKLRAAAEGDYDLILTDLQMPIMDGYETASGIRALPNRATAQLPIIALTANEMEIDWKRSQESGISEHLLKPMDLSQLLETIESLTGHPRP